MRQLCRPAGGPAVSWLIYCQRSPSEVREPPALKMSARGSRKLFRRAMAPPGPAPTWHHSARFCF